MTRRSYNGRAVDPDTALRELRANTGTRYDGRVVEALVSVLRTDEGVQAAAMENLLADIADMEAPAPTLPVAEPFIPEIPAILRQHPEVHHTRPQ